VGSIDGAGVPPKRLQINRWSSRAGPLLVRAPSWVWAMPMADARLAEGIWRRPLYRASKQLEHHESNAKIEFTWLTGVVVMFVW
jgi:hypothetical protein